MKKQGIKLFSGLIVLCSMAACSQAPLVYEHDCPIPPVPELPLLIAEKHIEHPENIEILMYRDDIMRFYIKALQDTLLCFDMKKE